MKDEIKEINITFPGQILDYVDTKEHLLELFNYITDLQEENKRLKIEKQEEYNRFNLMAKFRDKALARELIYKSRNEQAIECIKDFLCTEEYIKVDGIAIANNYIELLNILEGEDKE